MTVTVPELIAVLAVPRREVETYDQLKELLRWEAPTLTWVSRSKSSRYQESRIPKAKGGFRVLHIPDSTMRKVQNALLDHVFNCFTVPEYICAFETGRSIPQMVQRHLNQGIVVSMDISDFFGSTTQKRIKEFLLQAHPTLEFSETTAGLVAELVTYRYFLPQGGVTSPKVSNLVAMHTFGPLVKELCRERGYILSIYADDLTISIPDEDANGEEVRSLIQEVTRILRTFKYTINKKKTKVMRKHKRQYVCGAVVNRVVSLPRKDRDELKARVHNVYRNGWEAEATRAGYQDAELYKSYLRGRVSWYASLDARKGGALANKLRAVS